MWSSIHLLGLIISSASCYLYINRTTVECNSAIVNVNLEFFHDATGQCVINNNFTTHVTITKMRIYFKVNVAEDKFDKEFKKVIVSSVFDVEKVFQGMQSNLIINIFFTEIKKSMAFEYKMPLPPVSDNFAVKIEFLSFFQKGVYRFVNFTFGTSLVRFVPETAGMVDLRYVGNIRGSNKTIFFAHIALFGGLKHV